ncbi:tetratricopeptide repeat protein [bacterium]|nr:tetratricopeptide repeat protein [bacterium]
MTTGRFTKLEKPIEKPSAPAEPEAAPQQESGANDYPTFLNMADEAFFSGNYRDALRHYSRALQQESSQVYPWVGQISSLLALKQYREAELWSNRALEQFPEDPSLLSQRARVLAATGNIKRALGVSDYAISHGATTWTWLARGEVLLEANDTNALFCFEKAMELTGREDWRIPLLAGISFARKRQWASAEDFLRRATIANPKSAFGWYELARVLLEMAQTDRAVDCVNRAIQLNPGFRPAVQLKEKIYKQPLLHRILRRFIP